MIRDRRVQNQCFFQSNVSKLVFKHIQVLFAVIIERFFKKMHRKRIFDHLSRVQYVEVIHSWSTLEWFEETTKLKFSKEYFEATSFCDENTFQHFDK